MLTGLPRMVSAYTGTSDIGLCVIAMTGMAAVKLLIVFGNRPWVNALNCAWIGFGAMWMFGGLLHLGCLGGRKRRKCMEAVEFGKENRKKIVLIPGNMMSWRQFERVIPLLETDYHVTAVSTDGYDGSGQTTFTTAGTLFHRQNVRVGTLIMSGPQYMNLGILNGFVTKVIPRNQYRLLGKLKSREKMPWLLKLYTRSDDESLLKQFSAMPENISLETLQNCAREGLRLYEEIENYEPDPKARVSIWYGAKEPNMKKAVKALKRAFPNAEEHSFEGFGHGEIIAHPDVMAEQIRRFETGLC